MQGSAVGRHPWYLAAGSATDVEALSSDRHGSAGGCTLKVPGCLVFGLLFTE